MKLSLSAIRNSNGYTIDEAAELCKLSINRYQAIENNPGQAQLSEIIRIAYHFGVPINLIYPGAESDCINYNRKNCLSTRCLPNALNCTKFA